MIDRDVARTEADMVQHTVLIGYGVNGRTALKSLGMNDQRPGLTVVDVDGARVEQAAEDGARTIRGDGRDLRILREAGAQHADRLVVAVGNDALALRITAALRFINDDATVVTLISEPLLCEAVVCLGADHVIITSHAVEREPEAADEVPLTVAERNVREDEVGKSPVLCHPTMLAVVRNGRRIWLEDSGFLQYDDRVLEVRQT